MAEGKERIELTGPLEVGLPDGSVVSIRPGPYGKGISVIPQGAAPVKKAKRNPTSRGRGRPARPSTLALRAMLQKDAASGSLKEPTHYIQWLLGEEPKVAPTTLQQTAYRELRAIGGSRKPRRKGEGKGRALAGSRGRVPHPATMLLREKLQKDLLAGPLQSPAVYIRWVVDKADIGIKQARPIVYRELRAAKVAR